MLCNMHAYIYIHAYVYFSFRYLKALGKKRTAEVTRDAEIGEAENQRDAGMKKAVAHQEHMKAKYENDTAIAEAKRDFELKKAAYDMEVLIIFLDISRACRIIRIFLQCGLIENSIVQ